jgi:glycerol-3-phosphate O-acyltransferase
MQDEITQAVLARDDVAKYLRGDDDESTLQARERIQGYLDELRTTQRYKMYRALRHPLYPILRKVERRPEHLEHPRGAAAVGRVIYISNHRSHLDYLVELLVLDEAGLRPPIIAAGINLFGGALGLLHRHVTGAIPIRRDAKDPAYLATLKAYIAELLKTHDLFFYPEGGRSYSGELKSLKTGLLQASLHAERDHLAFVPCAVAYDLVLEDRILSKQGTKRRQRPFSREVAEMASAAVGFASRAFVTFGDPIPLRDWDPESRRDVVQLTHLVRDRIGRLIKVVPTALVAQCVKPGQSRDALVERVGHLIDALELVGANIDERHPVKAMECGIDQLVTRGVLAADRRGLRVRDRIVLKYYARTIDHLVAASHAPAAPAAH